MGARSGDRILDRRAHRHQRATRITGGIDSRPRGRRQSRTGASDHGRQYRACRRPRFAPVSAGKFAGLDNPCRVGNHRRAVRYAGCRRAYFSQTLNSSSDVPLWDRLFAPLLAAAAGALTTGIFSIPISPCQSHTIRTYASSISSAARLLRLSPSPWAWLPCGACRVCMRSSTA